MRLLKNEEGAEATQIAIAIAVLGVVSIGIYTGLAPHIAGIIEKVKTALTS